MEIRAISKTSETIIKLLKSGRSQNSIVKLGFAPMTVRYYYWKIYRPTRFAKHLEKIKIHNKKNRDKAKKAL